MARKPIFDFSVYTDGPVDSGPDEATYTENVWEDDDWKPKGPQLGKVLVTEKAKTSDPTKKDFVAKFTLKEGTKTTKITVRGDLPGGLNWIGAGPAEAEDDDSHARKGITVEGRNPKRW